LLKPHRARHFGQGSDVDDDLAYGKSDCNSQNLSDIASRS